jgi:hypothetical protein
MPHSIILFNFIDRKLSLIFKYFFRVIDNIIILNLKVTILLFTHIIIISFDILL